MGRPVCDRRYWDERAAFELLAAVLDEKDRRGRKNRYIDRIQKIALEAWFRGGGRVLDLGCGTGRLLGWLAERSAHVVGTDLSEGMLRAARSRMKDRPLVLYDGERLPFRDGSFEAVTAVGVFQDLPEDDLYLALLTETARCLAPGGRLYLLEQVSDRADRPWRGAGEVIDLCARAGLGLERKRPVRKGRWWLLYLIRYGVVPESLIDRAARYELRLREKEPGPIAYYIDYLFQLRKAGA